jgi:uncharacterized protein YndB with AHSA1/START domain
MKKLIPAVAVLVVLGLVGSGIEAAWAEEADAPQSLPGTGTASEVVAMKAKVVAINQKDRTVTVEDDQGIKMTIAADERVRNFKQIKKGDMVKIQYQESVAWELKKRDEKENPSKTTTTSVTAAKPGEKPGMTQSQQVDVMATVAAIDKKKTWVTLKGPEGNEVTVKVQDPDKLKKVKVGDQVFVSYTQALAISVESAE